MADGRSQEPVVPPRRRAVRAILFAMAALGVAAGAAVVARRYRTQVPVVHRPPRSAPVSTGHMKPPPALARAGTKDRAPHRPVPATVAEAVEEGKALSKRLANTFPNTPDAWELRARIRQWLGDSEGAVAAWHRCLELSPRYAYAYLGLASVAYRKDDYAKAVAWYRKALELEPRLDEAQRGLARALLDQGQATEAVEWLQSYVARHGQRASYHVLLAFAYQQLGAWERAREHYEAALQRDPNHTRAAYGAAMACMRLGRPEEGREYLARYRKLLEAEGKARRDEKSSYDDVTAMVEELGGFYTDAARLYFAQGQLSQAEALCRRAAMLCPEQIECRQALALICRRQGRLAEAIQILGDLAKRARAPEVYHLEIGRLELRRGRWREAERAFQAARQAAPKNAEACIALCRLYLNHGVRPDEAVALAKSAVALDPTAANYALLATAQHQLGHLADAIAALEQAVKLAPETREYRQALDRLVQQR